MLSFGKRITIDQFKNAKTERSFQKNKSGIS